VPHVRPCTGCAILSDWYLSNGLSSRPELLIPKGNEKRSGGTPSRNAPHRARQGIIGICQCGAGALARGILKRPFVAFDRIKRQPRLLLCRGPCFRRFLECHFQEPRIFHPLACEQFFDGENLNAG
jgi:hypothetical protein